MGPIFYKVSLNMDLFFQNQEKKKKEKKRKKENLNPIISPPLFL